MKVPMINLKHVKINQFSIKIHCWDLFMNSKSLLNSVGKHCVHTESLTL